jgi:hypothetical protein
MLAVSSFVWMFIAVASADPIPATGTGTAKAGQIAKYSERGGAALIKATAAGPLVLPREHIAKSVAYRCVHHPRFRGVSDMSGPHG